MTDGTKIHSELSEENYRKALRTVYYSRKLDIAAAGCIAALAADIVLLVKAFVTEDRLDFLMLMLVGIFIYFIIKIKSMPKQGTENALKKLNERTGGNILRTDVTFGAEEITLISYTSGEEVTVGYDELTLVREYDSFYGVFAGKKGFFVNKSDFENDGDLLAFLKQKCGDIEVKQC